MGVRDGCGGKPLPSATPPHHVRPQATPVKALGPDLPTNVVQGCVLGADLHSRPQPPSPPFKQRIHQRVTLAPGDDGGKGQWEGVGWGAVQPSHTAAGTA